MPVTPYLFLDGRCEEAIEFYKKTLGAEVQMMMRFKEAPDNNACTPSNLNKIMHACIAIDGTAVMLSDGRVENKPKFEGFALSVSPKNETEAKKTFAALSDGGQVQMPLAETFFAKSFGMCADKFGIGWMIIAGPKNP